MDSTSTYIWQFFGGINFRDPIFCHLNFSNGPLCHGMKIQKRFLIVVNLIHRININTYCKNLLFEKPIDKCGSKIDYCGKL